MRARSPFCVEDGLQAAMDGDPDRLAGLALDMLDQPAGIALAAQAHDVALPEAPIGPKGDGQPQFACLQETDRDMEVDV